MYLIANAHPKSGSKDREMRMLHHTSNMYPNWDRRWGDVKLYVTYTHPNTGERVASYVHTNWGCDCTFSIWVSVTMEKFCKTCTSPKRRRGGVV